MKDKLQQMRENYRKSSLERKDLDDDPMWQFGQWFEEAMSVKVPEMNAMTLATADENGHPSLRTVLLKGIEFGGFVFYTNYESRKGRQLDVNPNASLLFFWPSLERQIRIEGIVKKIPADASTEYFQSRPVGSQIGAWTSPQSEAIPDREFLELRLAEYYNKFRDRDPIPRPDHWGGYVLTPERLEFWQGREDRLHDRFEYQRVKEEWKLFRLAP